jgi:hypothetical protein
MKKLYVVKSIVLVTALAVVGCESEQEAQARRQYELQVQQQQLQAQQLELQQRQLNTQQQYAPGVQPQYGVAPIAGQVPVIVQQQPSGSGVGTFVAGAAAGALAGHVYNKMNEPDTHSAPTSPVSPTSTNVAPAHTTTNTPTPAVKTGGMDMAKLSESAKQQFNTGAPTPVAVAPTPKPNGMDMSKLSTPAPTVSLAKPTVAPKPSGFMNMGKSSKR